MKPNTQEAIDALAQNVVRRLEKWDKVCICVHVYGLRPSHRVLKALRKRGLIVKPRGTLGYIEFQSDPEQE